jgi:hypothetical protein
MSVTVNYYRMPNAERESVTHDQSSWEQFRHRIESESFQSFQSAIAGLEGFTGSQEERFDRLDKLILAGQNPRRFDMEKDWHSIGYLLTGSAEIIEEHRSDDLLHSVVFGGQMTPATTGYGPVRYFGSQLVTQSAEALGGINREIIRRRFEPARMADLRIYSSPDESEYEGLLKIVDKLTGFFQEAASAGEDIIKFAR